MDCGRGRLIGKEGVFGRVGGGGVAVGRALEDGTGHGGWAGGRMRVVMLQRVMRAV